MHNNQENVLQNSTTRSVENVDNHTMLHLYAWFLWSGSLQSVYQWDSQVILSLREKEEMFQPRNWSH